ncbi:unnamed protein product [Calypogeia fissa]
MKKKRADKKPAESSSARLTRNKTRQQQDEEPAKIRDDPLLLLKESPFGRSCPELRRNPDIQSKEMDPALAETLLAFLNTHGVRDMEDIEEDRLTFLEATYARCVVRADASVPTQKLFAAIYRNVQESRSLDVTMATFQLLKDLEKRHPRVAIATDEAAGSSGSSILRLDIDKRVWSPIESLIEFIASTDRMLPDASAEEPIPLNLLTLVETIALYISEQGSQLVNGSSSSALDSHDDVKMAGQFLMLQDLVGLIQNDLSCCLQVYEASMDHSAVQHSDLYRLLCVLRTDARKLFLSNLVFLLNPSVQHVHTDEEFLHDKEVDLCLTSKPGLLPSTRDFSDLAHKLLLMVMELDHVIKTWNPAHSRSMRRGSFPDDLLSIFSKARDLEAYLKAIESPRTKLRFIVDYFIAYAPADMIVKGLKDIIGRDTFEKLLACFGEDKMEKFVHKFGQDVLPVVLGHAFQAFLMVHSEAAGEDVESEQAKMLEMSRSLVEILTEIRALERQTEMLPVAEHAIQMAESILAFS